KAVERDLDRQWAPYVDAAKTAGLDSRLQTFLADKHKMAADKLKVRLGWMPRVHPFVLNKTDGTNRTYRIILPLYSDGFDLSLMAISDDGGVTWVTSEPLVGPGNVQPAICRRK